MKYFFLLLICLSFGCSTKSGESFKKRKIEFIKADLADIERSDRVYMGGSSLVGKDHPIYIHYLQLLRILPDSVWMRLAANKSVIMRIYAYEALRSKNDYLASIVTEKLKDDTTIFCYRADDVEMEQSVKNYLRFDVYVSKKSK